MLQADLGAERMRIANSASTNSPVGGSIQLSQAMRGANRYNVPFQTLPIAHQLTVILDIFGKVNKKGGKQVTVNTKKARSVVVFQFIEDLRKNGFPIKNILNLGQRHIKATVTIWLEAGLKKSTILARLATLRWLCSSIGKDDMIKDLTKYGLPTDYRDTDHATCAKARNDETLAITNELMVKVREVDALVAMNLALMQELSLSVRESILLCPFASASESTLALPRSSRTAKITTIQLNGRQRDLLQQASYLAILNPKRTLVHPGKTLQQSIKRVYYIAAKFGISIKPTRE